MSAATPIRSSPPFFPLGAAVVWPDAWAAGLGVEATAAVAAKVAAGAPVAAGVAAGAVAGAAAEDAPVGLAAGADVGDAGAPPHAARNTPVATVPIARNPRREIRSDPTFSSSRSASNSRGR
jgi:hypothetical protein